MGFKPRAEAQKYRVKSGDSLASLAVENSLTWEELALFNWGTKRADEVNRALVEIVGSTRPTYDGRSFRFSSDDSKRGTGEILIPRLYKKEGLATGRTYTITVDKPRPMPAVSITSLDQWFIPGPKDQDGECCIIGYALEGIKERADKVSWEVHGSNYCETSVAADGKASYTPIAGPLPLYKRDQPADRCQTRMGPSFKIVDWDGECDVASGMLKPSGGKPRYVNVAFSPYTVMLRFYKSEADKEARLLLQDFWIRWNEEGVMVSSSLNFQYEVKGGAGKLKHGQILLFDKTDKVVQRIPLATGDLTDGKHKYNWDARLADGSYPTREQMPYRFQLQAHSDMFEEQGLALAAMHTEVRLFAHPETGKNLIKEAHKDPNSLVLGLAPVAPEKPPEGDTVKWHQYQLAEGGFHPGPVDGLNAGGTTRALMEFQRTMPENQAAPFKRLRPTGSRDAETMAALKRLAPQTRPWFGDPSGRADLSRSVAQQRLRDPLHPHGLIAWVDDRHYYTEAPSGRPYHPPEMFLDNYRGGMSLGDGKVDRDARSITRPHIPLQADLPLLSRGTPLDATSGDVNEATRQAIGPLRVDWSFGEIGEDLSLINTSYDKSRIRSRKWVDEGTRALEASHKGKKHRNCPEDLGGIRPADMASYFKKGVVHGPRSLEPWPGEPDPATQSICTIVHDDLGQPPEKLYAEARGRAGAYAHLSRIAGDGYRYRAQVRFDKLPAGMSQFPNREVLLRRYPRLPQAHTSGIRLWRKTSYRGYIAWCPPSDSHWPTNRDGCSALYRPAFVHFVEEPGPDPTAAHSYSLRPLITSGEYAQCIATNVSHRKYRQPSVSLNMQYVWPFLHLPHWGIPQGGPGTTLSNFQDEVLDNAMWYIWSQFRKDLLLLLLSKIEQTVGRMRGHLLVEFLASPKMMLEEYKCAAPGCTSVRTEVTNGCAAGDLLVGKACPVGGTGHTFVRHNPPRQWERTNIPLPACGLAMGATWLFLTGNADIWAHELGHHRHLQHAQAWPGVAGSATAHDLGRSKTINGVKHKCGAAPGAQEKQHDPVVNPALAAEPAADPVHPNKDRCWDRMCMMSYERQPLYFCGRCLLKNRGWRVEGLAELPDTVHD